MPARRAPSQSRRKESPTSTVVSGRGVKRLESGAENRRVGLLGADAATIRHDSEQGGQTRAVAHRFEIAVEVRHDSEPVAFPQRLEDRPIARESGRRIGQETRRHTPAAFAVGPLLAVTVGGGPAARQFRFEVGGQRMDRLRQAGCRREASDEPVIGGEKGRRKGLGGHIQPFGLIEGVEAFLPRHAVGVERPAKVEEQRFDRVAHERPGRAATLAPRGASPGRSKGSPSMKALQASRATLSRSWRGGVFI